MLQSGACTAAGVTDHCGYKHAFHVRAVGWTTEKNDGFEHRFGRPAQDVADGAAAFCSLVVESVTVSPASPASPGISNADFPECTSQQGATAWCAHITSTVLAHYSKPPSPPPMKVRVNSAVAESWGDCDERA